MRLASKAVEQVAERGVEIHLDQYGHSKECDDERLGEDLLTLEAEEQHECRKERGEPPRANTAQRPSESLGLRQGNPLPN